MLGKATPWPEGLSCRVFFCFLLSCSVISRCHLEVTFAKQRALGHLSAANDGWEARAPVLQGLLGSTDGPLRKETLGFCSAGFAVMLQALSSVLQLCGCWAES